jgi:hypothetical protein
MMDGGSARRVRGEIDMRTFAKGAGATIHVAPGGIVFTKGEPGDCMYIFSFYTSDAADDK